MTPDVRPVSERADFLGESPVWDPQRRTLFWVDGFSKLIRSLEPATGTLGEWSVPSMIGSIGLGAGNTLIAALADGIYSFDLSDGQLLPLLRPEPAQPEVRFNDGKMDRQGRFLCGSMGVHAAPLGQLWRIDAQGRTATFADGIRISNSLCFSPAGDVMYFADSLDRKIRAYAYDAGERVTTHYDVLVDTNEWDSGPDGATVDAEGCLWVTLIQIGKIARFTPAGKLDRLLDAPVDLPSCLAFGGDDLSTLYVTSIKDSGSGRAVSKHPDGGRLYAIDGLGVKGLPEARFGGSANDMKKNEVA